MSSAADNRKIFAAAYPPRPDFASLLAAAINQQADAPRASVWAKQGQTPRVYVSQGQFLCVTQGGDVRRELRGRATYLPSALYRQQALAVAAGIEAYRADQWAALEAEAAARDAMHTPRSNPQRSRIPPKPVQATAAHALAMRRKYHRGGLTTQQAGRLRIGSGVARATTLAAGKGISPKTIKRMVAYFARHAGDKKAQGFHAGEIGYPSAGRVAWDLWGGDAGHAWAVKVAQQVNAA